MHQVGFEFVPAGIEPGLQRSAGPVGRDSGFGSVFRERQDPGFMAVYLVLQAMPLRQCRTHGLELCTFGFLAFRGGGFHFGASRSDRAVLPVPCEKREAHAKFEHQHVIATGIALAVCRHDAPVGALACDRLL